MSARDTPFTIPHPSLLPAVAVVREIQEAMVLMPSHRPQEPLAGLDMDSELTDMGTPTMQMVAGGLEGQDFMEMEPPTLNMEELEVLLRSFPGALELQAQEQDQVVVAIAAVLEEEELAHAMVAVVAVVIQAVVREVEEEDLSIQVQTN